MLIFISIKVCSQEKGSSHNCISPECFALSKDGKKAYVTLATAKKIGVIDLTANKMTGTFSLDGAPGGIALSADGSKIFVTLAEPQGFVQVLDTAGKTTGKYPVGHTPTGIAVGPDGKIYAANRFSNNVSILDASGKETAKIPMIREPHAVVLTGGKLFVANHLPFGATNLTFVTSSVSVIDTVSNKVKHIQLPNGAQSLNGICASPDGKYVYVTHILSRFQLPTTQLDRGWMNTNALSVIDPGSLTLSNTVLLDNIDKGAANPWGILVSSDGKYLYVAHAGTHEVSVIDRELMHKKLGVSAKGASSADVKPDASAAKKTSSYTPPVVNEDDVPNDLSFVVGIRQRVKLNENASKSSDIINWSPRGIIYSAGKVYTANYFSDTISIIEADAKEEAKVTFIKINPGMKESPARRGEKYFNDALSCFQTWQSCATCHPGGRDDGLNWDLLNDGIGNPKNTKNLVYSIKTPPVMVTGIRASAEVAIRTGMRYIQFGMPPQEELKDIDEYFKTMEPVPSPYLVNGKLSASAVNGEKVFKKAGCITCHPPPLFTDLQKYKLGLGDDMDKDREFDVPTLIELWRSLPYLYDGRAVTIKEVLTKFNPNDKHGTTSTLTPKELEDLTNYILSQ